MTRHIVLIALLLVGSFARADRKEAKADPVVARIVGLEIAEDGATVIIVAGGSNQGIKNTWRARVLDAKTKKPLDGGEAMLIRVDKRTSVLKTTLPADQIRANRSVKFDP